MTAYSLTVTNSVRAFGGGPPSLWNQYNWNAFKWGDGTTTIPHVMVHKLTVQSVAATSAVGGFQVKHLLTNQVLALANSTGFNRQKIITNALSPADDVSGLYVQDSNGYFRVFPEGVTNAVDRTTPDWESANSSAVTWTTGMAGSTVWS